MTKTKRYPYINIQSGDVQILTKAEGAKLSKEWNRGKLARNDEGAKVFRFKIATQMKDKNGKIQHGTATVDLQEIDTKEVTDDGNGSAE